jgi:hypothetical protein
LLAAATNAEPCPTTIVPVLLIVPVVEVAVVAFHVPALDTPPVAVVAKVLDVKVVLTAVVRVLFAVTAAPCVVVPLVTSEIVLNAVACVSVHPTVPVMVRLQAVVV